MLQSKSVVATAFGIAVMATLTIAAIRQNDTVETSDPRAVRPRHILVAPNVALHVVERGDPKGTPVVMIHGFSDSWSSFSRLADHLPRNLRLITVDLRGHGKSSKPVGDYSTATLAGDVAVLLDSLKINEAYVVGHSLGSLVAQHVVAQRPQRIQGLVLMGAARGGAYIAGIRDFQGAIDQFSNDAAPVPEPFAREFQLNSIHMPVPPAFLDSAVAASLELPVHVWKSVLRGLVSDSGAPVAKSMRTLVLWGEKEATMPREEHDALVRKHNATFYSIDSTGHSPHWERPEETARLLRQFIGIR